MFASYVLHYLKGFVACPYSPVLFLPGVRPDILKVSTYEHQLNCVQVVKTSNCKVLHNTCIHHVRMYYTPNPNPNPVSQSDRRGHDEVKGDVYGQNEYKLFSNIHGR